MPFLLIYALCRKPYLEAGLSPFVAIVYFAAGVVVKVISAVELLGIAKMQLKPTKSF